MVRLTPRPLCLQERSPGTLCVGARARLGVSEKRKSVACAGNRTLDCPARSQVTTPTELCLHVTWPERETDQPLASHAVPLQAWTGPEGSRRLKLPAFPVNRHTRLAATSTGRLHPPGNIPGTHFCWRLSRPQGHSAAGRIMSTNILIIMNLIGSFFSYLTTANQLHRLCSIYIKITNESA